MSTNGGLIKFNPQTTTLRSYDVWDGLQSNEFNSQACYESARGTFFFGGINGINAFDPESVKDNPHIPTVVLTAFKKYNKEAELSTSIAEISAITLAHTDDVISFEFSALDFRAPEKNQFAYKLEGFKDEWIDLGNVGMVFRVMSSIARPVMRAHAVRSSSVESRD